jgi:hypothetical protein
LKQGIRLQQDYPRCQQLRLLISCLSRLLYSVPLMHLQDSFKPPCSNIALGDERVSPFTTSYSTDFYAPFNAHERLRSPMRNKDLAATQTSLKEHYASSYNRVGE